MVIARDNGLPLKCYKWYKFYGTTYKVWYYLDKQELGKQVSMQMIATYVHSQTAATILLIIYPFHFFFVSHKLSFMVPKAQYVIFPDFIYKCMYSEPEDIMFLFTI